MNALAFSGVVLKLSGSCSIALPSATFLFDPKNEMIDAPSLNDRGDLPFGK